ncbi:Peptidoglycan/xylan/chitin deacetylase [Nostoc sphaeroides CCNUC1]|uniref:Peptidoglycan/xylan/chitin deacetylase n=1 Tax=Nostoc sphaeroides CCNUC1 TaxID=2653204 RepID=A0A5P8W3P5_9NOSO|nr:Peptidoglycan/xylan/chitin deacetylase [Nostoc sphaeroides CCNUC1]
MSLLNPLKSQTTAYDWVNLKKPEKPDVTNNSLKQQQIISFVAIASTITACSITPQLSLNKPLSKINIAQVPDHPAKSQINVQLQVYSGSVSKSYPQISTREQI